MNSYQTPELEAFRQHYSAIGLGSDFIRQFVR